MAMWPKLGLVFGMCCGCKMARNVSASEPGRALCGKNSPSCDPITPTLASTVMMKIYIYIYKCALPPNLTPKTSKVMLN